VFTILAPIYYLALDFPAKELIMTKFFQIKFVPLTAIKIPLHPLRIDTLSERSQANAVAVDGFNARPVLIDENAVVVDGVATLCALHEKGIDSVKVMLVGGASAKELRELRRALGELPNLDANVDRLMEGLECLLDAGCPLQTYIAGLVESLEALLESYGLPDAAAVSREAWDL
jgi:hypothetical protein